ncbi:NAD(P)/FAD-dependent oxidoreductase [Arthrobacter sp. C9C5]|uniref:phytoene desaturase family protein n=1 Tax=Arthrobacter sp. C9C5 TaxID=2735267 RepID=UPI001585B2B6|nr:NAD(P)/FAD-dependent oxidoreductase [Arthrobacter sp. C9C5]NUU31894.1 NAD(P)/FAD-dependent oxidoreductase [Arthrobacter sp. C9C5]
MVEHADAVVIGAGFGGLAAAVTLAGTGVRTVVFEQHSAPGGYATSFESGPYRFETALHALNGGPTPGGGADEVFRALGIADRLTMRRIDPHFLFRSAGAEIMAYADPYRHEAHLIHAFPGQAIGIRSYLDEALAVYRDTRRFQTDMVAGLVPSPPEMAVRYPVMVRALAETWEQMMARHVADPAVREALSPLWNFIGLPPSQCSAVGAAAMCAAYQEYGMWFPEGGAKAIGDALVRELVKRGGEIRCGQLVTGLDLDDSRAIAATTADGGRVEADLFISNASAPALLELVGRDALPADYIARIERVEPSLSTFAVYLGLDRDVFAENGLPHDLFIDRMGDSDRSFQAVLEGDWANVPLTATDYARIDPGCAPAGHGVVVISVWAKWDAEDTWGTGGRVADYQDQPQYRRVKERVADMLVDRLANEVPGLRDAIRTREVSTPLTNFRYTRNPKGASVGPENTPANTGTGALTAATPVRNLFLAGAWTGAAGMNPALSSGMAAALQGLSAQSAASSRT